MLVLWVNLYIDLILVSSDAVIAEVDTKYDEDILRNRNISQCEIEQ